MASINKEQVVNKINRIVPDWFTAHRALRQAFTQRDPNQKTSQLISFLWPTTDEYYSPLNPAFLFEGATLALLNSQPVWQVRDGLVPLLWFFKINPKPGLFVGKILVHEDFMPFVPSAWRAQTGSYSIQNTSPVTKGNPQKLILLGLVNERFCSTEYLEDTLQRVNSLLGEERVSKMEKLCLLLYKHTPFGVEKRSGFFFDYALKVFRRVGLSNITMVDWQAVQTIPSFGDYFAVDINERTLVADNYLLHFILGKGASLISLNKPQKERGKFIQLSPYHGISYQDRVKGEYMLDPKRKSLSSSLAFFSTFEKMMISEANLSIPWPAWFMDWTKACSPTQNGS